MYKPIVLVFILLAALHSACGVRQRRRKPAVATTPAASEEPNETSAGGETLSSSQLPISVTVTVPDGWEQPSDADLPELFAVVNEDGYIDFLQPTQVYNYATRNRKRADGPSG